LKPHPNQSWAAGAVVVVCASCLSFAEVAQAVEALDVDVPVPSPPATGGTEQSVVARYWEIGRVRPFLAASVEAGIIYLKPRFAAGYGRPHWSWFGVESYPVLGTSGAGHYSGLAATLPWVSLRGGTRFFYPYSRKLLEPRDHYERSHADLGTGPVGDYVAHEGELTATAPLFHGNVFAVLTGMRLALVPEGHYVYENSLKVIVRPPYVWRARLGYLFAFGPDAAIRVGAAAEVIGLPGRDAFVLRAGVLASLSISARLEAQASLIPVLLSPDSLGLEGSDFGQLGIRYRWATDSKPDPTRLRRFRRQQHNTSP
jgi:hypothetical protein